LLGLKWLADNLGDVEFTQVGGRRSESYHCGISPVSGATHGDDLFATSYMSAIRSHEDDLNTDLYPLAEDAEEISHDCRHTHTVEPIGMEKHGAEVNRVPLLF